MIIYRLFGVHAIAYEIMLAKIEPFEVLPQMILYMEICGWSRCAVVSQNGINIKVFKCSMKNARGRIKN